MEPERDKQELGVRGWGFGDGEVIFCTLLDIRITFLHVDPTMLKKNVSNLLKQRILYHFRWGTKLGNRAAVRFQEPLGI